jgi:hypothetical protein
MRAKFVLRSGVLFPFCGAIPRSVSNVNFFRCTTRFYAFDQAPGVPALPLWPVQKDNNHKSRGFRVRDRFKPMAPMRMPAPSAELSGFCKCRPEQGTPEKPPVAAKELAVKPVSEKWVKVCS